MEAVPAKVEIMALLAKQSCGKLKPTADIQPAGMTATDLLPKIFKAIRTAKEPPQPAQAL